MNAQPRIQSAGDQRNALPQTFTEAIEFFAKPDAAVKYLIGRRWPDGVRCPQCGSRHVYFDSSRNGWECRTRHPRRRFTLRVGTLFESSHLGFDKWLPAVWMVANGVGTSVAIHRMLHVTQKTAWLMVLRIRLALRCAARRDAV